MPCVCLCSTQDSHKTCGLTYTLHETDWDSLALEGVEVGSQFVSLETLKQEEEQELWPHLCLAGPQPSSAILRHRLGPGSL